MKYTIIICLLFVLSNSLKEFNNKFSKEKSLLRSNYGSNIEGPECNAETKDKCKALNIIEDIRVCCYDEIKNNDEIKSEKCRALPKVIDKIGKISNSKEMYSFNREKKGYKIIVEGQEFPEKEEEIVTCKNGVYRFVEDNVYSEKEKNVLEDENHCLNIYHKKLDNYKFNTGECTSHLLLDSSKKAGLECGYFEYNVTLESKTTISFNTCYLFNLNLFSKICEVKQFNTIFKYEDLEAIIYSMGYHNDYIQNFTAEAHNSKGHKIKYDSETDNVTIEGAGYMLSISKYLFVLILILF